MFKKVLSILFSQKHSLAPPPQTNSASFHVADKSPTPAAEKTATLKLDTPLLPHDADFLNYLFGESTLNTESDPFSDYVAVQVEKALRSPKAMLTELPVMPASVTTLISELKKEDFDVTTLLEVIEREPSMAADVIKLANSARYRRSEREVTDLKTAFMNMGARGLVEGVLEAYIKNFVPSVNIYWRQFGEKIWQHSSQTAAFAKELVPGDQMGQDQSTAYFVGLIRNLGKMIVFQIMVDAFKHVDPSVPPNSTAFKKLINGYAIKLTYTIAKYWDLPIPILKAIAYQASPLDQGSHMALSVFEANYLSELQCLLESNTIKPDEFEFRYQQNLTSRRARQIAVDMLEESQSQPQ